MKITLKSLILQQFHNIASESSSVYTKTKEFHGKKFIGNAKMVNLASFWEIVACGETVFPDRSTVY